MSPSGREPSSVFLSRTVIAVLMSGALACSRNASSDPDADSAESRAGAAVAAASVGLIASEQGVRFPIPQGWVYEPAEPLQPPAEALGVARPKNKESGAFSPRLVLTREPLTDGPEQAFSRALAELEALGTRTGITLERSGFSSRPAGDAEGAELQLRYRIGKPGVRLTHRAFLVARGGTLLTLTATYMASDRDAIEPVVDKVFDRIELRPLSPSSRSRQGAMPPADGGLK